MAEPGVFTQSRADRDAELAAHDQLSREAVELRAEVERLRAEYARATSSRDEYMNLHIERSDALIETCGRVDAAEARTEAAEARLRKVEALDDEWGRFEHIGSHLWAAHAADLRAALAAEPAEVTPPAEQRAEGGA